MIVILAVVQIVKGKGDDFAREFRKLGPKVRQDPGTIAYTLNRDIKDPDKFFFYEKYDSPDTLRFHTSTPHFKEFFETCGPLMMDKPEINMYKEVD